MKHLDLFSGIGGFAYAVDQVWDNAKHTFVENDTFCQKVLKKHWPKSKIYGDIRQFITNTESGKCGSDKVATNTRCKLSYYQKNEQELERKGSDKLRLEQPRNLGQPFILTGGFPCQPFSQAGQRKGTADNRYLWPEMFRVIQLTKPTWVIAENVRGLVTWNEGMVLEQVCADLESEGYEVQPFIIPAVAVNAPHRRDRVWIVANRTSINEEWGERQGGARGQSERETGNGNSDASNARFKRPQEQQEQAKGSEQYHINAQNTISERSRGRMESNGQVLERQSTQAKNERPSWEENWIEIATEFCSVDDGFPVELDGFKLTKSQNRAQQLKAYGNAIVPVVAEQIMRAIRLTED